MEKSKQNASWTPLLIAYVTFVALGMGGGILNIAWLYIQDTFQVSIDSIGVLLGALTIGHLGSSFLSGRGIQRFGTGTFLLMGTLAATIGVLVFMLAPSWGVLLIAALLGGIGGGITDSGMNTYVSAHYSAGRLNWLHAAFGVGTTIGPPIVTLIVITWGQSWRWSYVVVAGVYGLVSVIIFITRQQWRVLQNDEPNMTGQPVTGASVRDTLRVPLVMFGLLLFFFYAGAEAGVGQLTNNLFVEGRNIPQETATFWISVYWGSFTIGRIFMGVLADRMSNRTLIRLSMLAGLVGTLLLTLNLPDAGNFVALLITGFGFAALFPILIAETPQRVGLRHAPNAIGFQIGIAGMGIAFLPGLAGVLAASFGLEIIGPYLFGLVVASLIIYEIILRREAVRLAQAAPAD